MTDEIMCPDCEHSIVHHSRTLCCAKCWHDGVDADDACWVNPSVIARTYADRRVREALAAEPSEAEVEAVAELLHDRYGDDFVAEWEDIRPHMREEWRKEARDVLRAATKARAEQ